MSALSLPATRRLLPARPTLSGPVLSLLVVAFLIAADNATFWARSAAALAGHPVQLAVFVAAFAGLTLFVISVAGFRWLLKPVLVAMLMIGSAASWYQDQLGATIDREMIRNVMQTTFAEAHHLLTLPFALHLLLTGAVPVALVLWVRRRPASWLRDLGVWAGMVVLSLALLFGSLLSDFKAYSALIREHRDIPAAFQPLAPILGAIRYAKQELRSVNQVVTPLGTDAHKGARITAAGKPVVTVIFAGETARAQNWGANGYERMTSPETMAAGMVNFPDVESCGTATAVSLPCMFSNLTGDDFSHDAFGARENLLDVLTHAGVAVEWIDNNTGDQSIGKRSGTTGRIKLDPADPACAAGECTDAAFLPILREKLASVTEDTVLVFHMIGSHGPAYYLRYPEEFRRFTPDCRTADFNSCTPEEIRNAYDNTILFTDHILAEASRIMAGQDRVATAMLFLSDHGESLGESGLYLHGAPRFLAPETQYKVPMTLWLSDSYQAAMGLDAGCIAARAAAPLSQDYMFHTVLGMMDIVTGARDGQLDLTGGCVPASG